MKAWPLCRKSPPHFEPPVKNFRFRLDSVLRLRKQQVDAERMRLQQIFGEREQLTRCLASAGRERAEAAEFVRDLSAGTRDLRALASYIIGSQMQVATVQSALRELDRTLAEQKARVLRAEQNEKLLTTLREKRIREWTAGLNQQIETDAHECWIASWNKD